jgi:hypothetical protein
MYRHTLRQNRQKLPRSHTPRSSNNLAHLMTRPTVRERLGASFTDIRTEIIPIDFDLPLNPAGAVAFFRKYFGPTQVAFSRLDEAGQAAFAADLESLWAGANVAPDPENRTLIHNEYLQVTAVRS